MHPFLDCVDDCPDLLISLLTSPTPRDSSSQPRSGGCGFGGASSPAADRQSGLEGPRARQGPQQRAPKHWNLSLQSTRRVPYHPMPWHASTCGHQPQSSFLSLLPSGTRDLQHICAPEKDTRAPTSAKARFCFHDDAKTRVKSVWYVQFHLFSS